MWVLLPALASAAPEAPEAPVAPASEEVTVWGDPAVQAAREALIGELTGLGYRKLKERDGRLVLVHEQGWKGKVVLYDDGRLATKRTGPAFKELEPIGGTRIRPYPLCVIAPTACVSAGAWVVSERKWRHVEDEVARATAAEVGALSDRMADAALSDTLDALPARLEALWERGEPLDGGPPLPTPEARRAALLAFWESRTDTAWGRQVREAVEGFARGVIQPSGHPFTEAELAAHAARFAGATPFLAAAPAE